MLFFNSFKKKKINLNIFFDLILLMDFHSLKNSNDSDKEGLKDNPNHIIIK